MVIGTRCNILENDNVRIQEFVCIEYFDLYLRKMHIISYMKINKKKKNTHTQYILIVVVVI